MKKTISLLIIVIAASIIGCGKKPLFDILEEKNIDVVIKGTYESNSPRPWLPAVVDDDSMTVCPPDGGVDPATKPATYDYLPSTFYMDIAEMKLDSDKFANYRMLYSDPTTDSDPLFNGTGVLYENNNVRPNEVYNYLNVYFRRMIFDNASSFNASTGAFISNPQTYYGSTLINAFDFDVLEILSKYNTLVNNYTLLNYTFPLSVPISGNFVFDNTHDYVIELRIVVKNFIKRYESITTVNNVINSTHFFAFSDLFNDVRSGDAYIGGNVIAGARWYIKGQTTTIKGTVTGPGYVIAIPSGAYLPNYNAPLPTTTLRPADYYSPRIPLVGGTDIASLLENYVDKQKYNYDYSNGTQNNYIYVAQYVSPGVVSTTYTDTMYDTTWTNFNTVTSSYRLPDLATYTSGTAYTLTNVQAGKKYDLYWVSDASVTMGNLPTGFSLLHAALSVDVPLTAVGGPGITGIVIP
jgi:hypothetical protein